MSKITIDLTKTVKEIITTMKKAIDSLQDQLTFDSTPTSNSSNPVTSGGVKTALDKKADTSSLKTVATSGSYNDLTDRPTIPTVPTKVSAFTNDSGYLTTHQDLSGYQTKLTFDSTPTANSSNPVTSDGIKKAINTAVSTSKTEIEEKIPAVTVSGNTISFGSVTIGVD